MGRGKAEDADGLTPAKDGNVATPHFTRRTLLFFRCVDYIASAVEKNPWFLFRCAGYKSPSAAAEGP